MKIVQITPFLYPVKSGMENHVYEISKRLSKNFHVTILSSNIDRDGNKLPTKENLNKIEVQRFKVLLKLSEFSLYFPSVFKENYDIVHTHAYRHPHTFVPFFTNTPCIITSHYPI